jgi:hypothetical protein
VVFSQNKKQILEQQQATIDSLKTQLFDSNKEKQKLEFSYQQLVKKLSQKQDSLELWKHLNISLTYKLNKANSDLQFLHSENTKLETELRELKDSVIQLYDSIAAYQLVENPNDVNHDLKLKKSMAINFKVDSKEILKASTTTLTNIDDWLSQFNPTANIQFTFIDKEYAKPYIDAMRLNVGKENLQDSIIQKMEQIWGKTRVSTTIYDCGIILYEIFYFEETFTSLEIPKITVEKAKANLQSLIGRQYWGENWKQHPNNIQFTKSQIGTRVSWSLNP